MTLPLSGSLPEYTLGDCKQRSRRLSWRAGRLPRVPVASVRPGRGPEGLGVHELRCLAGQGRTAVLTNPDSLSQSGLVQWEADAVVNKEWAQLQDQCSGALEMLELLLLSRKSWKHVHAAVYCRSPESFANGELLFKLANNMDLIGGDSKTEMNTNLFLGNADAESFLATNEYLELPHKSCSVFPLTQGLQVVGLLLLVLGEEQICENSSQNDAHALGKKETGASNFLKNDLDALQSTKKALSSGCALYHSAVLASAISLASRQSAYVLLSEMKGPVKVVRTMADMLHYRTEPNSPGQDMVQNIQDQGASLSEFVNKLEGAILTHPHSQIAPYSFQLPATEDFQAERDSLEELDIPRS